jgi:hypothetical protein
MVLLVEREGVGHDDRKYAGMEKPRIDVEGACGRKCRETARALTLR